MDTITLLLLSLLPALVIVAGLSDLTTLRIPNILSGALILAFFPAALAVGLSLSEVGLHGAVAILALLIGMVLFATNVIGGGDAKLMAAACLWLGPSASFEFVLWTAIFGGALSVGLLFARQNLTAYANGAPHWVGVLLKDKGDVPYGVAIAGGALVAFPASALLVTFAAG